MARTRDDEGQRVNTPCGMRHAAVGRWERWKHSTSVCGQGLDPTGHKTNEVVEEDQVVVVGESEIASRVRLVRPSIGGVRPRGPYPPGRATGGCHSCSCCWYGSCFMGGSATGGCHSCSCCWYGSCFMGARGGRRCGPAYRSRSRPPAAPTPPAARSPPAGTGPPPSRPCYDVRGHVVRGHV